VDDVMSAEEKALEREAKRGMNDDEGSILRNSISAENVYDKFLSLNLVLTFALEFRRNYPKAAKTNA
jgi:hypothetical protein